LGGWVCFTIALAQIGVLTAGIGDLAELFGCCAKIEDSVTAITIVALGTSLPDLFASKTAATEDEYADASIVNVTGSNSVNVFLGIGLPWLLASVYWFFVGQSDQWLRKYGDLKDVHPNAAFIVTSGDLSFSVMVFTINALVGLAIIRGRRVIYGGELGGPSDPKSCSSFLLVLLWIIYIALSIWKTTEKDATIVTQVVALLLCFPIMVFCMIIFMILLQVLKISRKYIGDEGFWGIFVATCLIGGRMFFFLIFQMGN
jgi:solute carrier family 8 (sodium/calcium exchanger)